MRKCTKCLIEKELSEFNKRTKVKSGYASICRDCNKLNLKKHYNENKQYYKEKQVKKLHR